MKRSDRKRAERISEYVEGLVVHRREEQLRSLSPDDHEFRELAELARVLIRIDLRVPEGFRDDLHERLAVSGDDFTAQRPAMDRSGWVSRVFVRPLSAVLQFAPSAAVCRAAAAVAVLAAAAVLLISHVATPPTVSAAEILGRADAALGKLVRPGQILYRRWKVTDRVTEPSGATSMREAVSHEWMDGADFGRVAGRNERDGRPYLIYASTRDDGELRPRVYFAPGFSNEPRGLLSIEPSRREFHQALGLFGSPDRERLHTYLARGYIFEPISGERRFNQLALETAPERDGPLPRVVTSLDEETLSTGIPVYVVRIGDPARVRFRWRSVGSPSVWIEQRETVRYIARDTYLSLRSEEYYATEGGGVVFSTRELVETRIVLANAIDPDPFAVTVPEGTPVRRQSAGEQLRAVAAALRTVPARLTTSSWTPARPAERNADGR